MRDDAMIRHSEMRPRFFMTSVIFFGLLFAAASWVQTGFTSEESNKPQAESGEDRLDALHQNAKAARGERRLAEVERLRLARRKLISGFPGSSPWRQGMIAIKEAEKAVELMEYERACQILEAAWKPFAAMPSPRVVMGDVPVQLFFATEAARMLDPNRAYVAPDRLRQMLERAAADDPCQIEAVAALAFLTRPDAGESFQRQNDRESIRARNDRLLSIGGGADSGGQILPWAAAVEFLRAKSTSFVLRDIDYLETFLDPRTQLAGTNRHGQAWCLTLGGGVLGLSTERSGDRVQEVIAVDSYDRDRHIWRNLRPQILVVSAAVADADAEPWRIKQSAVQSRLKSLLIDLEAEVKRNGDSALVAIARRFTPDVVAGVEQIRNGTWKNGPPPGSPIAAVLRQAATEFGVLSSNRPNEAELAAQAKKDIEALLKDCIIVEEIKASLSNSGLPSVADNTALRQLVERPAFSQQSAEPDSESDTEAPSDTGGFGGPRQRAPLRAAQLKAELLDALARAELLASVQAYQADDTGLPLVRKVHERAEAMKQRLEQAGEELTSMQRRLVAQINDATSRLEKIFAKVEAAEVLTLADFTTMRRQLEIVLLSVLNLEFQEGKHLGERLLMLTKVFDGVVKPAEIRARVLGLAAGKPPVRSWKIGAVGWRFYDFGSVGARDAAFLVDMFPPLVLAASDLDAVSQHLKDGGQNPAAPELKPGSASAGSLIPLVDIRKRLRVRITSPSTTIVKIVLVESNDNPPARGPQTLLNEQGQPYLLLDDNGVSRPMRLDFEAGRLVVEYPGVEGHIPIGISANSAAESRFIRDNRGYRISAAPRNRPGVFRIVAANGEEVDGSFHSVADLVDLDRNIINEFLPPGLMYAPSLKSWQVYREQLLRRSPDARIRWALPRPVYRVDR